MDLNTVNMEEELDVVQPSLELRNMPLKAVGFETLEEVSRGLKFTVTKIVETTTLTANTEGFIEFLGFTRDESLLNHPLSFARLIDLWENSPNHLHAPSAGKLIEILHIFERYDILYNIKDHIEKDLEQWRRKVEEMNRIAEEGTCSSGDEKTYAKPDDTGPEDSLPAQSITCPTPEEDTYDAIFSYDTENEYSEYIMEEIYRHLKTMYQLNLCRSEFCCNVNDL